jgi:2'-5' RNA ligase
MRIFLAVDLDASLRSGIAAIQQLLYRKEIPGIRWSRPDGIHLTLRFCGEVSGSTVDRLVQALAPGAPYPPFSIRIGGLGTFPPGRAPRVLFLAVHDTGSIGSLAAWVEERSVSAGLSREPRPFHPHLTLGRFREGTRRLARELLEPSPAWDLGELRVDRIVMFESHLGSGGARYTALQSFALLGTGVP